MKYKNIILLFADTCQASLLFNDVGLLSLVGCSSTVKNRHATKFLGVFFLVACHFPNNPFTLDFLCCRLYRTSSNQGHECSLRQLHIVFSLL